MIFMRSDRLNMVIPAWLKAEAQRIAKSKGISLSEYIKDALKSAIIADSGTSRESKIERK
jgi:predicted HicB family RNase H-like nuclease